MNLSLDDNVTRLVLLLVAGVVALLVINMKKKLLGDKVAVGLSVAVIAVCGYCGYMLLNPMPLENYSNQEDEDVTQPPTVYEGFQDNAPTTVANQTEQVETEPVETEPVETDAVEQEENNVVANNSTTMSVDDLLPNGNTKHSENNPSGNGSVLTASLLNAGHHIGVNTTGCSMRNANRGLRSEPPNPQTQVSPWLQTTICPDPYRKPLDCAGN